MSTVVRVGEETIEKSTEIRREKETLVVEEGKFNINYKLELGTSLGSSSLFEPDFRFKVNKPKARARSSLISSKLYWAFLAKLLVKSQILSNCGINCWAWQGSNPYLPKLELNWPNSEMLSSVGLDICRLDPAVLIINVSQLFLKSSTTSTPVEIPIVEITIHHHWKRVSDIEIDIIYLNDPWAVLKLSKTRLFPNFLTKFEEITLRLSISV